MQYQKKKKYENNVEIEFLRLAGSRSFNRHELIFFCNSLHMCSNELTSYKQLKYICHKCQFTFSSFFLLQNIKIQKSNEDKEFARGINF